MFTRCSPDVFHLAGAELQPQTARAQMPPRGKPAAEKPRRTSANWAGRARGRSALRSSGGLPCPFNTPLSAPSIDRAQPPELPPIGIRAPAPLFVRATMRRMAKFLAGVGFGQASGSVAGSTYSHNRYGAYLRNRAMPVNPSSTKQQQIRSKFASLSQGWRALTAAQRLEWNTQAPNIVLYDSLGQQYSPTGQQFYIGINQVRLLVGLATTSTPPAQQTQAVITSGSCVSTGSTGVQTVTFAPAIGTGAYYILRATAPQSAGKTFIPRSAYKDVAYLTNSDTSPYVATTAWAAIFGGLTTSDVGKKIFWQLVPVSSNGFKGVPFGFSNVVA